MLIVVPPPVGVHDEERIAVVVPTVEAIEKQALLSISKLINETNNIRKRD
jgi:hypothetical protein